MIGVLICITGIQDYMQAVDEPARMLSSTLSLSGLILFAAGIYQIIKSKKKKKGYRYIFIGILCALISVISTSSTISNMMPFYLQIQIILKGILYVGAAVTGYGIYSLITEK